MAPGVVVGVLVMVGMPRASALSVVLELGPSRPHLGRISAASRLYLGCISPVGWPWVEGMRSYAEQYQLQHRTAVRGPFIGCGAEREVADEREDHLNGGTVQCARASRVSHLSLSLSHLVFKLL